MDPVILFRVSNSDESREADIARKYFPVVNSRVQCQNKLVIGRYSVLPYYRELDVDLRLNYSQLINSYHQHQWIANFDYYEDLEDFTAKSYDSNNFWQAPEGAYVVKGRTNSRKHQWKTHMFAASKLEAVKIGAELLQDGLLCSQGIIYREFIPLNVLEVDDISGLPYANEWRFFFYKRTMLTYGFYWSSSKDDTIKSARMSDDGLAFAHQVADVAADYANFYVLDIAERKNGGWALIEVNDAQMSGLSENAPETLYGELKAALELDAG